MQLNLTFSFSIEECVHLHAESLMLPRSQISEFVWMNEFGMSLNLFESYFKLDKPWKA